MDRTKKKPLRSTELENNKKQKRLKIIYLLIIAAVIFISIILIYKINHITYHSFKIEEGATWSISSHNQYLPYKNGIIKYNKDGAEAITLNGSLLWNVPYNMKNPIVEICGSYVAIADKGGKSLIIVNGSGTPRNLSLVYNISMISVSEEGFTLVIADNGLDNMFYVYKHDSKDQDDYINDGFTSVLNSGFPLDTAISPDGMNNVTAYILMQEEDALSTCTVFYNYGSVGRSKYNGIVAGFKDTGFLSRTYFINNETVLVLKAEGFILYNRPNEPVETAEIIIKEEILKAAYSNSMICLLIKNNNEQGQFKINCYDLKGVLISEFYIQEKYDNIMTSGKDIVLYNKSSFSIYNKNGIIKMQGELEKSYIHIYPVNNKDKYLLVGEGYMDILKLVPAND